MVNDASTVTFVSVAFDKIMVKEKPVNVFETTNKGFDKVTINSLAFKDFSRSITIKLKSIILIR
jgi:hypothetical protein